MGSLADRAKEMRNAIWEKEPKEVRKALVEAEGTFGTSFFPAMYAIEGSRNMHMTFVALRKVALDEASDVGTVKLAVKWYLKGTITPVLLWGGLPGVGEWLEQIATEIESVNTRGELVAIISELALYLGRLNYWLDAAAPWYDLLTAYDSAKKTICAS
jgi:hypothetical protein